MIFRHLKYVFKTLFELKNNFEIEDMNESLKGFVFTQFWTPEMFL